MIEFAIALVAVAAIFGVIGLVYWRGRQIGELARNGVNVTGRVTRKFRSGSAGNAGTRGYRIEFEYIGPDGQTYTRYHNATMGQFERWEEGSAFDLVCLPNTPGVSAERSLVDAAREALRKKGGAS